MQCAEQKFEGNRSATDACMQLKYSGCVIYHLRNDKVFECFAYEDWLGLFQQLGVIPPLGQGRE